jgi:hypothetical protein
VVGVVIAAGAVLLLRQVTNWGEIGEPPAAHAPTDAPVHRVLVVADPGRAAAGYEELVSAHADGRPTEAYVVVPTRASRLDWLAGDEKAYDGASRQLEETLAALTETGVAAHGRIGANDPLQAIDDALREFPAEEIVAAIDDDALDRARTRYELPIVGVGA